MRFSTFATSVALLFGSAALAAPTASPAALVERGEQLSNIDASGLVARDVDAPAAVVDFENNDVEEEQEDSLLEARKPKWEKVKVENKAGSGKGGKISQKEWHEVEPLAQRALYQADCSSGDVTHKYHLDGSQDDKYHWTVAPKGGNGASKGQIHLYKDGSWSQGKGGSANHGDGKI
ncbi:hypothetical protein PG989_013629 [Apiospora arundinis]